jgi:5-methylcytosine-specific restriction endonuclease McrA
MARNSTNEENRLIKTAGELIRQLRLLNHGAPLRLCSRVPKPFDTNTGGWAVKVGHLHGRQVTLDVWLDRYSRHKEPKFSACFYSTNGARIASLVKQAPSDWEIGKLTGDDYEETRSEINVLKQKLRPDQFNRPIEERYPEDGHHFFGIYDVTAAKAGADYGFIEEAVGFFTDVLRGVCDEHSRDESAFPRVEERKLVQAHLSRERSRFLAAQCKKRDGYQCQVCSMTFAAVYGEELGGGFAEAHHVRPLATLGNRVKTRLEDLITVCANCHRMLHRMDGVKGDVERLRAAMVRGKGRRKS